MVLRHIGVLLIVMGLIFAACSENDMPTNSFRSSNYDPDIMDDNSDLPNDSSGAKGTWDIPRSNVVLGCLGRDCIPSLQSPEMIPVNSVSFMEADDLVYGLVLDDEVRCYPVKILDWHEVINQSYRNMQVSITYCPLTGSGLAAELSKIHPERLRSFGVSGLLYNNNLIMYDRGTGGHWAQMLVRSVNGEFRGEPIPTIPLIETSWATWKKMFPDSRVVSTNTGFDRPYNVFPYGNYKTTPGLLFPIEIDDTRLPRKERVHGIIADRFDLRAKVYRFSSFKEARAINDKVHGQPVVVAGMKSSDLYLSYSRVAQDGKVLEFDIKTENPDIFPFDLVDDEGNVWNLLGEAISGPRAGETLEPTVSYNAYWFAWGTFFPNVPKFIDLQ